MKHRTRLLLTALALVLLGVAGGFSRNLGSLQTEAQRSQAREAVVRSWASAVGEGAPARSELLQGAQGLDVARLEVLLEQQDRSRVSLKE